MTEVDLQRGAYDKAEQRARTILSDHPSQGAGHRLLGDIALARGRPGEAVSAYRAALDRQRDSDGALRLYRALFASGQDGAALEFMEGWLRRNPRDAIATQALPRLPAGRESARRTIAVRSLARASRDPHILNNWRISSRDGGQKASTTLPRAPRYRRTTSGHPGLAAGAARRSGRELRTSGAGARPQNPDIRYHLAAALAKIGRKEEAQQELDEALRTKVAFDDIEAARSLLRSLTGP
jgi:tetratricopeptide (TPR) repeat protein